MLRWLLTAVPSIVFKSRGAEFVVDFADILEEHAAITSHFSSVVSLRAAVFAALNTPFVQGEEQFPHQFKQNLSSALSKCLFHLPAVKCTTPGQ